MAEYIVKQAHWGDRTNADGSVVRHRFQPGEVREAEPGEVETHLKFRHLEPRLPQLDHDQDGSPGGSKKKPPAGHLLDQAEA
jgi:hypothetical protein